MKFNLNVKKQPLFSNDVECLKCEGYGKINDSFCGYCEGYGFVNKKFNCEHIFAVLKKDRCFQYSKCNKCNFEKRTDSGD